MKKISFFGDVLVDLVKNGSNFTAQVGGSVFNTCIGTRSLGLDVQYISSIGDDYWGRFIIDYCRKHCISVDNIHKTNSIKTSLAFATLDENGDACYDFYKFDDEYEFDPTTLADSYLFHFGSTFSLKPVNKNNLAGFLSYCKTHNILTSYDPNYRAGTSDVEAIKALMKNVDIVKLSDQDARAIFGTEDSDISINNILDMGAKLVVLTLSSRGSLAATRSHRGTAECCKKNRPIANTIGAGDHFTAGMIGYLASCDILNLECLDEKRLVELCQAGNKSAAEHLYGEK